MQQERSLKHVKLPKETVSHSPRLRPLAPTNVELAMVAPGIQNLTSLLPHWTLLWEDKGGKKVQLRRSTQAGNVALCIHKHTQDTGPLSSPPNYVSRKTRGDHKEEPALSRKHCAQIKYNRTITAHINSEIQPQAHNSWKRIQLYIHLKRPARCSS